MMRVRIQAKWQRRHVGTGMTGGSEGRFHLCQGNRNHTLAWGGGKALRVSGVLPTVGLCKGIRLMRYILPLICLTVLIATAGCETVEGAGRDMSSAGKAVTSEAQKANN
jgi:predicted small secreted protein